ncbi:MAG: M48 family metallopeptidase [Clostridia bacterium]|nr:M48 family metallopeptidase [Clostridia bacterium]
MESSGYTVIKSRRKTIGLSVGRGGEIIVRAPYGCSKRAIERFVRDSEGWIAKQRKKLLDMEAEAEDQGKLTEADIKALADGMRAVLPDKLARYSALLGVTYSRVSVRCQKTKWGSCSAAGNLNFNCLLMLAPESVLDYVVVHELCHIKHMDHSKAFWADVAAVFPAYAECRAWLRKNGGALLMRARER